MGKQARRKREAEAGPGAMPAWTPLRPAKVDGSHYVSDGVDKFLVFKNSRYTVFKRTLEPASEHTPTLVHLSVKRNDKGPDIPWRDLQAIKNELVGSNCEGVEIFPVEDRLVDTANQRHLWVIADPAFRFPFGYTERLVGETSLDGSVQEPFEPHVRPADLAEQEEKMRQAAAEYQARGGRAALRDALDGV